MRIGSDKILIAYDEYNALYLFNVSGGKPIALFSYASVTEPTDKEVDVEAAAVVRDGIWWIGSHGRDGEGDKAPQRQIMFKTNAPDSAVAELQITQVVDNLLDEIIEADEAHQYFTKKQLKKRPKKGGFNVEGLAALPNGELLIGLRSPLTSGTSGLALIVHVAELDGVFSVHNFYQLDLGDRGIRDIQAADEGFMLIAGDVASGGVSAIYSWQPGRPAKVLTHIDRRLNPEALVGFDDHWLVLSDDGKMQRRDKKYCDQLARQGSFDDEDVYFRAIKLPNQALTRK